MHVCFCSGSVVELLGLKTGIWTFTLIVLTLIWAERNVGFPFPAAPRTLLWVNPANTLLTRMQHTSSRSYRLECVIGSFWKTWEHKQEVKKIRQTRAHHIQHNSCLCNLMFKAYDLLWKVKLSRGLNPSFLIVFLLKGGCDKHTVWIWHSSERRKYAFAKRIFTIHKLNFSVEQNWI